MGDPKTVREWLEKLPEPIRTAAINQMDSFAGSARTLIDALKRFATWRDTSEGYEYWQGVVWYLHGSEIEIDSIYFEGYTAAKAAFEAQQKPEPLPLYPTPSAVRELLGMAKKPNPVIVGGKFHLHEGSNADGDLVGYMAVAPDDYAELVRKAAAYHDLKAVIERLSCELEDLKKLFV